MTHQTTDAARAEYATTVRHWSERVVAADHDDGPDELLAHIRAVLAVAAPDGVNPVVALVTVLAAQVDPTAPPTRRLGWVEQPPTTRRRARDVRPCGTEAAYKRHLRRGELPCLACVDAHAAYARAYEARRRASSTDRMTS